MVNYNQFADDLYATLIDIEYYVSGTKYSIDNINYYDFEFHNYDNYQHSGQKANKHPLLKEYKEELINALQNQKPIPKIYLDCNDSSFLQGDVRIIESFLKYIKEPNERIEIYNNIFDLMDVSIILESLNYLEKEEQINLMDLVLNQHKNEKPRLTFLYNLMKTNFYNTIFNQDGLFNYYREVILEILEHNYPLIEQEDESKTKMLYVNSSSIRETLEKWIKKNESPDNWFLYNKFFLKFLYEDEKQDLFEDNVYSIFQMRINYNPIMKTNEFITNYNEVKFLCSSIIDVIKSELYQFAGLNSIMSLKETENYKDIGLILNDNVEKEKIIENVKKIIEGCFQYYNNCIYQGVNIETEQLAQKSLKENFLAIRLELNIPQKTENRPKKKI